MAAACPGHPPASEQITVPIWGGLVGGRDKPRPWRGLGWGDRVGDDRGSRTARRRLNKRY